MYDSEHGSDSAGVLGANPVECEAVGHIQRGARKVFRDLGAEGFDPGSELLGGQILGQLLQAGLPQCLTLSLLPI